MNSLEVGTTVRIAEEQCIGQEDLVARGIVVETRIAPPGRPQGTEYKVWWDDGFQADWYFPEELEIANDSELSLPCFGDA